VDGLFFLARAVTLAEQDSPVQIAIAKYALKKYRAYHGSDQGWDEVLNTAKENSKPPTGFTISKSAFAPVAAESLQQNRADSSFSTR
jgi:hypothetical protein